MFQADEDGRYPLSTLEYQAIRHIFGLIDACTRMDDIKDRLKATKTGWRDMRLIMTLGDKVLEQLLDTIPFKKLRAMREEIRRTVCKIEIRGAAGKATEDLMVVPLEALTRVMDRAVQMDCTFCAKEGKQARKCPLYKDLTACIVYDFPPQKDGSCPLAGSSELGSDGG